MISIGQFRFHDILWSSIILAPALIPLGLKLEEKKGQVDIL